MGMDTSLFRYLIFHLFPVTLIEASYCYYSYYYENYYCSGGSTEALDSRSIAGIVVGCVVAIAAIAVLVVFCKKKDNSNTRVVEIRSNGNTQVHTITNMHPPPGPPGGYPGMSRPPAYGVAAPGYPSTNMYPPPSSGISPPPQFGELPGSFSGHPQPAFPPSGTGMPPPSC